LRTDNLKKRKKFSQILVRTSPSISENSFSVMEEPQLGVSLTPPEGGASITLTAFHEKIKKCCNQLRVFWCIPAAAAGLYYQTKDHSYLSIITVLSGYAGLARVHSR
jgi:hypothetical protein